MVLCLSLEQQLWLCSYRAIPNTGGEYCSGQPTMALTARDKLKTSGKYSLHVETKEKHRQWKYLGKKIPQNKAEKKSLQVTFLMFPLFKKKKKACAFVF